MWRCRHCGAKDESLERDIRERRKMNEGSKELFMLSAYEAQHEIWLRILKPQLAAANSGRSS